MKAKRILRLVGPWSLLMVMTVLGAGVSAAQTEPATLTKTECWIEGVIGGGGTHRCELWIDNPSGDMLVISVKWGDEPWRQAFSSDDKSIDRIITNLDLNDVDYSNVIIAGDNTTTGKTDIPETTVPGIGTWH